MKAITIEIPDGKKAEWQNGVLTLVDDKSKDVTERIKTFEDACNELGAEHPFIGQYEQISAAYQGEDGIADVIAYLQCRIICAALNEGWENPQDCKTTVYYAWYWLYDHKPTSDEMCSSEVPVDVDMAKYGLPAGLACSYSDVAPSVAVADFGSRLCFKTRELAAYASRQFADIFLDFLLIRK